MTSTRSPWGWIPALYVAEGLPYFAVNTLAVLMYTRLGVSNAEMAFYTGWLYLPWVIKPFWSPFVDLVSTKRRWVIVMQAAIAVAMAGVAFSLSLPVYFAVSLAAFWLMAFCSATHDIAADGYYMLALTHHQQAAYVGLRSTFYRVASVIGQGGLVIIAGYLERTTGDIPRAWSAVFLLLSVLFLLLALYHTRAMPRVEHRSACRPTVRSIIAGFGNTFATFFAKPHIVSALAFMLLYRFPEAMMSKLVQPFLVQPRDVGGLGLSTGQVGIANGTVGVIGLLLGGILGGLAISRGGLKRWLWPMALALTLPCGFYCYLAMAQPTDFLLISAGIFIEQFGYGFGFAAFMLYLIYFSEGPHKTSHYAFCTAFMALGMMLPGMAAGWIHQQLDSITIFPHAAPQGYVNFFWWVMVCCIPTFIVSATVSIAPSFGRKSPSRS
ncbi:MAG: MFS transporter [Pseudoflavonifractor sp.]|nr:MFS transporter [Pseudoflavonifractor sp.]